LAELIKEVEEKTFDQTDFTLHLAVDYGGRDEIERAVEKKCHGEPCRTMTQPMSSFNRAQDDINIRSYLDHPELPDIDIIIRTSGEKRTSNFFLWQAAYAEWIFEDKLFPDFEVRDLEKAVSDYEHRGRRYGS
jgi:undecaprenyl diphosphate synthase